MKAAVSTTIKSTPFSDTTTVFTVADARRALPYLSRVLRDAHNALYEAQFIHAQLDMPSPTKQRAQLINMQEIILNRLNETIDEANALHVEHIDIARGIVGFRTNIHGRDACLIWHVDDPTTHPWPDID